MEALDPFEYKDGVQSRPKASERGLMRVTYADQAEGVAQCQELLPPDVVGADRAREENYRILPLAQCYIMPDNAIMLAHTRFIALMKVNQRSTRGIVNSVVTLAETVLVNHHCSVP
jgi:hypothetical protein